MVNLAREGEPARLADRMLAAERPREGFPSPLVSRAPGSLRKPQLREGRSLRREASKHRPVGALDRAAQAERLNTDSRMRRISAR